MINFIIELYEKIRDKNLYSGYLKLIIGTSDPENLNSIRDTIAANKYGSNIVLLSGIPYTDLIANYKGADLLLIPLRDTIQDTARFPHKISEYTAAGKPLISTNIGELKYYFEDNNSAILANEYTMDAYIQCLEKALKEEGKLKKIGENGYQVGRNNFHYQANIIPLKGFFEMLCKKNIGKKTIELATTAS
ncbi:MAG: glycosyltransferase [Ferruginibacter sp.]